MEYILIGDSHSDICRDALKEAIPEVSISPYVCYAGSAMGLSNLKSKSGYRKYIINILKQVPVNRKIIFK